MKSSLSKRALALMALLLCLAVFLPAALAADEITVQIDAQVTLEGTLPAAAETYTLRMTADDAASPMPDGQTGGSFDLSVTGADTAAFPAMTFDRVGIYTYTIRQDPGTNKDCTYDGRVYSLTVSVVNGEKGGLEAVVAMRQDGVSDKKEDKALFHNVYKTIVKPTTPPGTVTQTGVTDHWMYYLGGAALLLIAAIVIVHFLRRKEDHSSDAQ